MTMWLSQFSTRVDVVDLVSQFETSTRDRLMGQLAMWTMYIHSRNDDGRSLLVLVCYSRNDDGRSLLSPRVIRKNRFSILVKRGWKKN